MSDVLRPYRDLFPQIGQRVMIDDSSVVIGDVRLADDVGIWPLVVIRGDVHYVQIGARTNIQDGSMLHVTHKSSYNPDGNPLTIGEDVTVGHKVMLHGCTIGNRVLVGMGSILLDGAIVEDDVMIGAGSLVPQNKRLESGYLYLGSPVKQIRPLSDEEKAGLRYSANNYVKWKDEYLAVTPWGDFYPCHQFVGQEEFLLGNVYDGIVKQDICDEFKQCNVYAKPACQNCFAKYYCSGGCNANAYNFTGSITGSYDVGCKMQQKRIECAIMIKAALADMEEETGASADVAGEISHVC